jgi:hypothetical protein
MVRGQVLHCPRQTRQEQRDSCLGGPVAAADDRRDTSPGEGKRPWSAVGKRGQGEPICERRVVFPWAPEAAGPWWPCLARELLGRGPPVPLFLLCGWGWLWRGEGECRPGTWKGKGSRRGARDILLHSFLQGVPGT